MHMVAQNVFVSHYVQCHFLAQEVVVTFVHLWIHNMVDQ